MYILYNIYNKKLKSYLNFKIPNNNIKTNDNQLLFQNVAWKKIDKGQG